MTRTRLRRFAAIILAFSLVTAGFAPATGPVGTATATHGGDCTELDEFLWVLTIGVYGSDQCDSSHLSNTIEEMEQDTEDVNKVNIHQGATEVASNADTFTATYNNSLQQLRTPLWSQGEAAALDAIANGSSASTANSKADSAVVKRQSVKQRNAIAAWNDQMSQLRNLVKMRDNTTIADSYINVSGDGNDGFGGIQAGSFENYSYTLANGTNVTALYLEIEHGADAVATESGPTSARAWSPEHIPTAIIYNGGGSGGDYNHGTPTSVYVKPPDSGYDKAVVASFSSPKHPEWHALLSDTNTISSNVKSSLDPYVKDVHEAAGSSEVNASDFLSASTLAQEYATDYNSSGYYAYAVSAAATGGYRLPDLNTTGGMTVQYNGYNYTGFLMSQTAPNNGTWESGKTYNASKIDGIQMVVTEDAQRQELKGTFTIEEIRNESGSTITNTTVNKYYYEATNSSEYIETQEELNDLREEIREIEPSGGGGSSGSGLSSKQMLVLGGVALLLLMARGGN